PHAPHGAAGRFAPPPTPPAAGPRPPPPHPHPPRQPPPRQPQAASAVLGSAGTAAAIRVTANAVLRILPVIFMIFPPLLTGSCYVTVTNPSRSGQFRSTSRI